MKNLFVNNIGDLAETQRASFYRFIMKGIKEEFLNFPNPFSTKIKILGRKKIQCSIFLYPNEIKVKGPNFSLKTCSRRNLTYSINLYIPGEYSFFQDEKKNILSHEKYLELRTINSSKFEKYEKIRMKQNIFFGEIPLMTEEGTFLITGCERIVISQIIRSPGIYFRKEFGINRKTIYTATVISNKGLWTKFILDQRKFLSKKNPKKKLSIELDRIYMKINDYKSKGITLNKRNEPFDDNNKLFVTKILSFFGLNLEEITDSLKYPLRIIDLQLMQNAFASFPVPTNQNLAKKLSSKKLENNSILKRLFLNQRAGCFSIGEIGRYKINKKLNLNLPKEITHLTAHDFLGILDGLIELKYYDRPSDDIDHIKNKQVRSVGELLQLQIRTGLYRLKRSVKKGRSFTNSQKLTFELEASWEPEDWIIDPRPLTNSVKEFFKTSQLSQYMDQINPLAELTHKRKISVFGPNGLKRDHISTVIRDIHPSQYGRLCPIETSEGQNAGLIMSMALYGRVNSLGSIETPYFFMEDGRVFSEKSPLYFNPEQESEIKVAFGDIALDKERKIKKKYLSCKDNYIFSVLESNQLNFLTTSTLQVISLATSLIPFLEHDDANRALMGSNMQRQAVPLLYTQKPIVGTGFETVAILDSGMVIKTFCEGKVFLASSESIIISDIYEQKITYLLRKYYRSNQETSLNHRPIVWNGETVFSGQIIADGPSTNDGELSLGHNLTIAYMPWEGYNYEDAIVISERILLEDCLTSVHFEEYETSILYGLEGTEKLSNKLPYQTKYVQRNLDNNGIIKIGSYVKEHDILVGKLTPCVEDTSPEANLMRAIFGKKAEKKFQDTSLKVGLGTEGRVVDIRILSTTLLTKDESSSATSSETIRIYIAQIRKVQIGDKLAGRHGNKGIISRILARQDMPYLPDGTPIDILFNPLGVPSRMNVGQIFECLLGLAGEKLGKRYKVSPFDEIYGEEASRILVNQKLKESSVFKNCDWLFNEYYPGKILLRDGRTGEFFDNPITVGKTYILKLIHLVEDKIHARSTGPYAMITEQPLAGKSQKGGQRFGEMEVWALEAYGCSNILQELLTIKSDDIDGRNDMYEAILTYNEVEKPTPSFPESFLALVRELNALGLDLSFKQFQSGFSSTSDIQEKEKNIFHDLETRLKLRGLLERQKSEQFVQTLSKMKETEIINFDRKKEKKQILEKIKKIRKKEK